MMTTNWCMAALCTFFAFVFVEAACIKSEFEHLNKDKFWKFIRWKLHPNDRITPKIQVNIIQKVEYNYMPYNSNSNIKWLIIWILWATFIHKIKVGKIWNNRYLNKSSLFLLEFKLSYLIHKSNHRIVNICASCAYQPSAHVTMAIFPVSLFIHNSNITGSNVCLLSSLDISSYLQLSLAILSIATLCHIAFLQPTILSLITISFDRG